MPRTTAIIEGLDTFMLGVIFGNAFISIINEQSIIESHCGPTNLRVRCHLGLQVSYQSFHIWTIIYVYIWCFLKCLLGFAANCQPWIEILWIRLYNRAHFFFLSFASFFCLNWSPSSTAVRNKFSTLVPSLAETSKHFSAPTSLAILANNLTSECFPCTSSCFLSQCVPTMIIGAFGTMSLTDSAHFNWMLWRLFGEMTW